MFLHRTLLVRKVRVSTPYLSRLGGYVFLHRTLLVRKVRVSTPYLSGLSTMSFYTLLLCRTGLPLVLIGLLGTTLELFTEFFTASDRDGSRTAHASAFRKAFKAAWKPVLTKVAYAEADSLLNELLKDPVKKVNPLSFPSFLSLSSSFLVHCVHVTHTCQDTPVWPPRRDRGPYVPPVYGPAPGVLPPQPTPSALPPKPAYAGKAPCTHCGHDLSLFLVFPLVFFLTEVWIDLVWIGLGAVRLMTFNPPPLHSGGVTHNESRCWDLHPEQRSAENGRGLVACLLPPFCGAGPM